MNTSLRILFLALALPVLALETKPVLAAAPVAAVAAPQAGSRDVIGEIMTVVGLKPRFEVLASAEVDNAAAVILYGKRYILYNPRFLEAVNNAAQTNWAGVSILAHEIGHHLNGHTLSSRGSNLPDELEADEFSGFVLRKMGASLADAQAAMDLLAEEEASQTHPGRSARLASIGAGWKLANAQQLASNNAVARKAPAAPVKTTPRTVQAKPRTQPQATFAQLDKRYVLGRVVFDNNPGKNFYITTQLNVLEEKNRGLQLVGKLAETDSNAYPFVLTSSTYSSLLITDSGIVVNQHGQRVGRLQQV